MKNITKSIIDLLIEKLNTEGLGEYKFIDFIYSHELHKQSIIIKDRNNVHYLCKVTELEPKDLREMSDYDNEKRWKQEYGDKPTSVLLDEKKKFRKDTPIYKIISDIIKSR